MRLPGRSLLVLLVLALLGGGRAGAAVLHGAVYSAGGEPVAGARVAAYAVEDAAARAARWTSPAPERQPAAGSDGPLLAVTDAAGRFTLAGTPDALLLVEAAADGFVPAQAAVLPGEESVVVTVEEGTTTTGRVIGDGRAATGATVVWMRGEHHDVVVRADAEGRFRLTTPRPGLPPGLLVVHPDFAPRRLERDVPEGEAVALERGRTVAGRVTDPRGRSVAGAALEVDGLPAGVSGEDGRFALARVPSGARRLRAVAGDRVGEAALGGGAAGATPSETLHGARERDVALGDGRIGGAAEGGSVDGGAADGGAPDGGAVLGRGLEAGAVAGHTAAGGGVFEIVVAPAGRVEGTVRLARDGARRGLAGAALTFHPLDRETVWPPVVVAGPGGRFAATGLPPGRYAVSALAGLERRVREIASPGPASGEAPNVVTVRAGERALHDVELELPPAVRGRVLDAAGRPVGGAAVALVPEREAAAHLAFDPAGPRTDAAGRFALPLLWIDGPQRLQVAALRRGHSPARSEPFALERGVGVPRDVHVDVLLADEAPVRVRVTAGGAPVAGARVAVLVAEAGGWGRLPPVEMLLAAPGAAVVASREGVADLFLAPGSYRLGVAAAGYQTAVQDLDVPAPRPLAVEVALARGFEIAGRVVRGGRPVANVLVHLGSRVRSEEPQVTGADGRFRLRDLPAGEHRLVVVADDGRFREERTATAPATGLVIELPPAGALALTVTDRRTGAPVDDLAVEVLATGEEGEGAMRERGARHHGARHHGGRGEGGRLVLDGLPVGEVEVTVGAAGYLPSGPQRVTIAADRTAELAVALDPGAALAGRVVDEAGEPVAEAQVHALPARPPERGGLRFGPPAATTEADGSYRLSGLAAGRVTLQVHAAGFVAHREELEVRGDQRLDVRLSRGLVLSGVVTAGGEPIAGAQVGASSAALAGQHQAAVSGDDGRFTLTGLVAARYTVSAFKEGHGHRQVDGVHPREVRELVLDLGGAATAVIEGVVRGLPAAAGGAAAATVAAHGDSGGAEAPVEPDGTFRIERVPAGVVRVQAWVASEEGSFQSSPLVVEVGEGETAWVELEFGAAVRVTGRVTLDGEPAAGARVAFGGPDGAWANVVADAAGEYRAALPRPGRYVVSVHDEPRLPSPYQEVHEIEGDRRLDLDVRERWLSGSVLDAATGEPLREAFVTLYSAAPGRQALVAEAMTDRRGRFALPLSGPGPYELLAGAVGYGQARVETPGDGEVVLELTPVGALAVRVVEGAGGEPLQAHLVVRDEAGLLLPVRGGAQPDGTHHLSLAPGRYLVTAIAPGYGERTVAVRAPGELEIALGPAGHLLVETLPDVGGRLHLVGADGVEHQSCCGDLGWEVSGTVTSIRGLAAGRYTLELRGADGRVLAAVPVAVEPGATARARIG